MFLRACAPSHAMRCSAHCRSRRDLSLARERSGGRLWMATSFPSNHLTCFLPGISPRCRSLSAIRPKKGIFSLHWLGQISRLRSMTFSLAASLTNSMVPTLRTPFVRSIPAPMRIVQRLRRPNFSCRPPTFHCRGGHEWTVPLSLSPSSAGNCEP